MSTLKPKSKSKKPGKSSKSDPKNRDLSQLHKPNKISVSSIKDAAKLLETGTQEIKDLLTYEANLLYECRICRSIFRSLINLLSHKRVYCREKVNVFSENKSRDDNAKSANISPEDLENLGLDQITLDNLENPTRNDRILRSQAPSKSSKKDLTSVLHMLQKKQVENLGDTTNQKENHVVETEQVVLQVLDSKQAAFQTLVEPNLSQDDLMENQVMELDNMLNQDTVVLGADGQIEKSDSPVHFYSNEETNKWVCDTCSHAFATQKTLNSHIKIKHAIRDCYLCPCNPCSCSFTSLASVKRHLTNVHRKIGPELKNLCQQTEKLTLRTKIIPAVVNKKPKKPENTGNFIEESQEWGLDPHVEMHGCISCGEKFDGKSELQNHSKNCLVQNEVTIPEEIAAFKESLADNDIICEDDPDMEENLDEPSSPEAMEIVSPIVFDTNQGSSSTEVTSTVSFDKEGTNNMSIRVQGVSSLSEEDWRKLPDWSSETEETARTVNPMDVNLSREVILSIKKPNRPLITESRIVETPQIVYTAVDNSKKRKFSSLNEGNGPVVQGGKFKKVSSQEGEVEKVESGKASVQLFSDRIASISDHTKLECIACRRTFTSITSLNRHMENHIKIHRYRCNKCNFRSVNRNDCVGHCNKMHNAKNNRQVLNEMISPISQDQMTLSQEMITVEPSNLNTYEMRRAFSDADRRLGNITPVTNVHQKHHNKQPLPSSPGNWKDGKISIITSDQVNRSDTDTETEDREAVYRRIDSNPNLNEMIRVVIGTNANVATPDSNSNLNGGSHSLLQNYNLERAREEKIDGYSPAFGEIDFEYIDDEDDITPEFYPRRRKSSLGSRSNSRNGNRSSSRASKRSNSQNAKGSELRMETRSSSRLGKKLDSEDEDEITREFYKGEERDLSSRRSSSRMSKRSASRMETRSESRMMTRSQSRLEMNSDSCLGDEETDEDYWRGYSRDLNSEGKSPRPKSRAGKDKDTKEPRGRSVSWQSRGKSRGRRSAPGKIDNNCRGREERSESFSENSQVQRPVRNRVKPVDKDFIYDLEEVTFRKEPTYSPCSSSGKKSSNGNQFSIDRRFSFNATKRLFDDEPVDLDFIHLRTNSGSDEENSELFFRGFPRQPEILNVE